MMSPQNLNRMAADTYRWYFVSILRLRHKEGWLVNYWQSG